MKGRDYRLIYKDGTLSRAITRDEAEAEFATDPTVAEIAHVIRRRPGTPVHWEVKQEARA